MIIFMNIFYAKRVHIDIKQYWKNFLVIVLATAPIVIGTILIKKVLPIETWLSFAANVIAFSAIYCTIYYFFVANDYEKQLIKNLKNKLMGHGG